MIFPFVLRPQYKTVVAPTTFDANVATWDGYCLVMGYATGLLTKTGSRVRLTLTPPTSGANLVIAGCYIGMANTAPSFDGNQIQVTFSNGSAGVTLTAGGGTTLSDPINFRITTSGTLLIAFGITSGDTRKITTAPADYTTYQKAADAANVGTTSKSGYSTLGSITHAVSLIEVLN